LPRPTFTFAVVGRDEAQRLPESLRQAREAARGDDVLFVDSGSSDGSAEVAAALGARVLGAPTGKGRAIARLLGEVTTDYVVLLDADIDGTTSNIATRLREAVERNEADLVVAEFEEPLLQVRDSSRYVWRPLVHALFPEAHERFGRTPLSGFRALRTSVELGPLPKGFGVETHINIAVTVAGGSVRVEDVGMYWGPVRSKPLLPREVGTAILDLAQVHGRLDRSSRAAWDEWLEGIVAIVVERAASAADGPTPSENLAEPDYVSRLQAASSRPLPVVPASATQLRPSRAADASFQRTE
jgi:glucosyl-3-phosphoglycerate synthase